jgi:hypothetical protein
VGQKWKSGNKSANGGSHKRSSLTETFHLKIDPSQQGASSSGTPVRGADISSQNGADVKRTEGSNSPAVRNLTSLLIKVTCVGASRFV